MFSCVISRLISEKKQIEKQTADMRKILEKRITQLEEELETTRRQMQAAACGADVKKEKIDEKINQIEDKINQEKEDEMVPMSMHFEYFNIFYKFSSYIFITVNSVARHEVSNVNTEGDW